MQNMTIAYSAFYMHINYIFYLQPQDRPLRFHHSSTFNALTNVFVSNMIVQISTVGGTYFFKVVLTTQSFLLYLLVDQYAMYACKLHRSP